MTVRIIESMAGWFSRVMQGSHPAEAEPVAFSLTCRCGGNVTGVRGHRMQVVVCRECAYQICVLPVSPYPRPKVRVPKKKPARPLLTAELAEEATRTPPPASATRSRRQGSSPKSAGKKTIHKAAAAREPAVSTPAWSFKPAQVFTPLRLIAVGMVAVVFLSGWWVVHRRALGQAVLTYAGASKAGRAALAAADFDTADKQLQQAVTAIDLLGRSDRDSRQVRQLSREAAAARGLASSSLFELIGDARRAKQHSPQDWASGLLSSHYGRWFLLESDGLQFATGDPPIWTFTLPLIPGADAIVVSGDLSQWAKQLGTEPPQHVILAGQLEDIRPLGGEGEGWQIVLRKDSLCLWTSPDVYAAVGGVLDDRARDTLTAQAQLLELVE